MIENNELPLESLNENRLRDPEFIARMTKAASEPTSDLDLGDRFAVTLADYEIVRLVAEKIGVPYDEGWSYKVIHPHASDENTLVMARKDIPDEEKPSALVLP
jgi:hypothetical protein